MNQVKYYREKAGIQQSELARRVGITRQALSLIELNQCDPSVKTAMKIAKELKIDWERLYETV